MSFNDGAFITNQHQAAQLADIILDEQEVLDRNTHEVCVLFWINEDGWTNQITLTNMTPEAVAEVVDDIDTATYAIVAFPYTSETISPFMDLARNLLLDERCRDVLIVRTAARSFISLNTIMDDDQLDKNCGCLAAKDMVTIPDTNLILHDLDYAQLEGSLLLDKVDYD